MPNRSPVVVRSRRVPRAAAGEPLVSASSPVPTSPPVRSSAPPATLSTMISDRIRHRVGERVQDLEVVVEGNSVILQGRCVTYYTKQLAQHAALGVLNQEHLDNRIEVQVT